MTLSKLTLTLSATPTLFLVALGLHAYAVDGASVMPPVWHAACSPSTLLASCVPVLSPCIPCAVFLPATLMPLPPSRCTLPGEYRHHPHGVG